MPRTRKYKKRKWELPRSTRSTRQSTDLKQGTSEPPMFRSSKEKQKSKQDVPGGGTKRTQQGTGGASQAQQNRQALARSKNQSKQASDGKSLSRTKPKGGPDTNRKMLQRKPEGQSPQSQAGGESQGAGSVNRGVMGVDMRPDSLAPQMGQMAAQTQVAANQMQDQKQAQQRQQQSSAIQGAQTAGEMLDIANDPNTPQQVAQEMRAAAEAQAHAQNLRRQNQAMQADQDAVTKARADGVANWSEFSSVEAAQRAAQRGIPVSWDGYIQRRNEYGFTPKQVQEIQQQSREQSVENINRQAGELGAGGPIITEGASDQERYDAAQAILNAQEQQAGLGDPEQRRQTLERRQDQREDQLRRRRAQAFSDPTGTPAETGFALNPGQRRNESYGDFRDRQEVLSESMMTRDAIGHQMGGTQVQAGQGGATITRRPDPTTQEATSQARLSAIQRQDARQQAEADRNLQRQQMQSQLYGTMLENQPEPGSMTEQQSTRADFLQQKIDRIDQMLAEESGGQYGQGNYLFDGEERENLKRQRAAYENRLAFDTGDPDPMPDDPSQLRDGFIYNTPKGVMRYNANANNGQGGFEPVQ